jgi:SAM-dependent methyltransferase
MVNFIEHNDYFTKIYSAGGWGGEDCPSGGGSTPDNTIEYREFLENFLIENKIKSVYDFGCGDWSFSKLINWSNVKYTGVDVVKSVIDGNNANEYSSENIKFVHLKDTEKFYRGKGDLLIIKDVLQHWTNEEITSFLDVVVNNFKFILITNSSPQEKDWQETPERNRPLSCKFYPLKKYNIKHLFNFGEKEISVIEN